MIRAPAVYTPGRRLVAGRRQALRKVPVGEGTVHDLSVEAAASSPTSGEEVREGPPGDGHGGCAGVG